MTNSLIYLILIFYYQHNFILNSYSFISRLRELDLKLVNAVSTLVLLLVSFLIIFLFRSSFIQSKAKKEIYNNMYEQIFEQQMTLSNNLIPLLNKSQNNIEQLNKKLDYIVQRYCEDLTKNRFTWRRNNLEIKTEHSRSERIRNRKSTTFERFEDFTEEVNAIFDSFEKLDTYKHQSVYLNVNKKVRYECIRLALYPKSKGIRRLDKQLLCKSYLASIYDTRIKNSIHIQEKISSYPELEEFEMKYLEDSIKKEVTTYHAILREDFEESVYNRILCDQFTSHLENKSKLNLKDFLLTK